MLMEGARGQWSPIDDTLCVVDMRELAVGSNLARKRKVCGQPQVWLS